MPQTIIRRVRRFVFAEIEGIEFAEIHQLDLLIVRRLHLSVYTTTGGDAAAVGPCCQSPPSSSFFLFPAADSVRANSCLR